MYGESFTVAQFLITKGVGLTYLIAFTVAYRQYRGLCGEDGILPVKDFVDENSFWDSISIFHFFNSDKDLKYASVAGIFLSLSVVAGIPSRISSFYSFFTWILFFQINGLAAFCQAVFWAGVFGR